MCLAYILLMVASSFVPLTTSSAVSQSSSRSNLDGIMRDFLAWACWCGPSNAGSKEKTVTIHEVVWPKIVTLCMPNMRAAANVQKWALSPFTRRHYSSHFNSFQENDFCILRDRRKGQKYFIGPLHAEGKLFISKGVVSHQDIIAKPPRSVIQTHNGIVRFCFGIHAPAA